MTIKINGKEMDASEITLQDAIESIFGKQYNDIPDEYNDPDEYLKLKGLNLTYKNCGTKEQVNDLSRKLKERLVWIGKHKNYKYDNIVEFLQSNIESLTEQIDICNNVIDGTKLVIGYINSVTEQTKKK